MVDLSLARKAAILAFIPAGGITLEELADHFGRTWKEMRDELSALFMIEVPDGGFYTSPYDITFDNDEPSARSMVYLTRMRADEFPVPSLTLSEAITMLGLVDQALGASDSDDTQSLMDFRSRLADAVSDAGYGSVLWQAPQMTTRRDVIDTLTAAIETRHFVTIDYWFVTDGELSVQSRTVAPAAITTHAQPKLICANRADERRTYRLDRICQVTTAESTFTKAYARKILADEEATDAFGTLPVTLRTTSAARWLAEYVSGAQIEKDGAELIVSFNVSSYTWLRRLAIRLGHDLLSIEPAQARDDVVRYARSLIEADA